MTVASETSRNDYVGNGATATYTYGFRIFAATDLRVTQADTAGVETDLVYLTDYTVTGVGSFNGGTITLTAGNLPSGYPLTIRFKTTLTQGTDLRNQGGYFPETVEDTLDRLTRIDQQQQDEIDRGLRLPETEAGTEALRTLPGDRANTFLAFDSSKNPIAATGVPSTPVSTFMATVVDDTTSNAVLTTLTATRAEAGAAAVPVLTKLREQATFADFGAVGNGTTDDTAAVNAALAAGKPIDGVGLVYAVTGNITLPAGANIKDATFKQLAPAGAGDVRTLTSASVDNLTLRNVTVNKNGDGTNGQLSLDAGIWISGGAGHLLEDVTVYGNDMGSGIAMDACSESQLVRPVVRDISYSLGADPGDDRVQGIWLNGCSDCSIDHPYVHDLGGNYGAGATTKYSRGLVLGGCSNCPVTSPRVRNADQGIDITGSAGNQNITVTGGHVKDMYTYGYKAANSASDCTFTGCVAERCGYAGFIVSGAAAAALPNCEDIMFVGCKAKDTGSNGNWAAFATGFLVLQGAFALTYPRGVRFIGCDATDEQGVPTMLWGFRNQIAVSATGHQFNECVNCTVRGAVTAGYDGMNYGGVRAIRAAVQSLANATYTTILWTGTEDYDGALMHDTATNADRVYARRSGWYRVHAQVSFAANATGARRARLSKNGTLLNVTEAAGVATAGDVCTVPISTVIFLLAGDYVTASGYQASGGNLDVRPNESFFEVNEVSGAGG